MKLENFLPRAASVIAATSLVELLRIQEARNRRPFLGFLVDHQRRADAAVRVAAAGKRTPLRIRSVHQIGEAGERADEGNREPVARGLDFAHLRADVLRQVRKRVALADAAFGSDFLVAPGERNGLEGHEGDFLRVFHRELHDRAYLIVVHVVDDGGDQHDFDAGFVHVLDGAQLHVEQVAHLAVAVRVVTDAVELQVRVAHAGFEGLLAEFLALGEFDAVGRGLHAVVADFARVTHRVKETRVHGGLAAGELHGHLPARLDLGGVLENFLNFFPAQFVDVAHLVRVHEAGIAHHVAAIGEVHGENGTTAVANRAGTVAMQTFVVVRRNIAARGNSFQSIPGTWHPRPSSLHTFRGWGIPSPSRPGHRAR